MTIRRSPPLRRRISDFCRLRLSAVLAPRDVERVQTYLSGLMAERQWPPMRGRAIDWAEIAGAVQVSAMDLARA